jgi:hypothetical protein
MIAMARTLKEIARFDRRWFRAHPERRHRCRLPDTGELDLRDSAPGAPLVMAIRHLGRGHLVYQPVICQGVLPKDERSAAALFALAAISPDPIPVIAECTCCCYDGVCAPRRMPRGFPHGAMENPEQRSGEVVLSCAAACPIQGKSGHAEVDGGMEGESC